MRREQQLARLNEALAACDQLPPSPARTRILLALIDAHAVATVDAEDERREAQAALDARRAA